MSALACSSMHLFTQCTQLRSPSLNFYTTTQLRLRAGKCNMPGLVVLKMSIAMLTENVKGVAAGRDGKSEFICPYICRTRSGLTALVNHRHRISAGAGAIADATHTHSSDCPTA